MAEKKRILSSRPASATQLSLCLKKLKKGERADKMAQHRSSSSLLHLGGRGRRQVQGQSGYKGVLQTSQCHIPENLGQNQNKKQDDLIRNLLKTKKVNYRISLQVCTYPRKQKPLPGSVAVASPSHCLTQSRKLRLRILRLERCLSDKGTCSCRGCELDSQDPHGDLQPLIVQCRGV